MATYRTEGKASFSESSNNKNACYRLYQLARFSALPLLSITIRLAEVTYSKDEQHGRTIMYNLK